MLRVIVRIAPVFLLLFSAMAIASEALALALPGESLLYTYVANTNADLVVRDLTRLMTYNITYQSRATDEGGAWSPDGRQLAFISTRRGMRELFIMSLAYPRGLTVIPTGSIGVGWRPVWSPDGTHIAFEIDDGRALQIAVYDLLAPEGENNPLRLTDAPVDSRFPAWSPDGRQLAYVTWSEGDAEIFLHTFATGETQNITQSEGWDTTPVWSPDGRRIIFYSDRSGARELYLLSLDSGETEQLTYFDRARTAHYYSPPAWSPDGRQIAFVGPVGMNGDVVIISIGGEAVVETDDRRLYTHIIFDTAPLWTPESDGVIFMSYVTGRWSLYNKPLSAPAYELTPGGNEIDVSFASWWPR